MMTSTKNSKNIAAAQKAGRYAAREWEPEEISLGDHRLRSLMNFERDVVKSTWEDTTALPLWNAFLEAFDAESNKAVALDSENSGLSDSKVIRMDEARSCRFVEALCDASNAVETLRSTAPFFPTPSFKIGEIIPAVTVDAFTSQILKLTGLLHEMVQNEEERDA